MIKLSGPSLPPRDGGPPKQAVVLLHGYGSDGNDLIGLATYWRDILPEAIFIAPNGHQACGSNPMGYQWFHVDLNRPGFRLEGAAAAQPIIAGFLGDLWQQTGLAAKDTILAGFSQGAMMALNVGLSLDATLMGIIGFSGALIVPPEVLDREGPKPPVCLIHGDRDQVVDPSLSERAAAMLRGKGYAVSYHVEIGAGHTIATDGLVFASDFIRKVAAAA